jgi:hypothetical protein
VEVTSAQAIADRFHPNPRHETESEPEFRRDRGPSWGDQLVWFIDLAEWNSTENLQSGRSRDREDSVGAADGSVAFIQLRNVDTFYSKRLHSYAGADDVCNGVECADFVEVDIL